MRGAQLALPVQLVQTPSFQNFFPGPNSATVTALRAALDDVAAPAVWLHGGASSGKTHLLRAAARGEGRYVSLHHELVALDDGALANSPGVLALDEADVAVQLPESALRLLRLIDSRRARGLPLLLAAARAPSRLDACLPDLATRLAGMLLLGLKPLRESDRAELLRVHARERGLDLPAEAAAWLLGHLRRDAGTLIAALEEIDRAALSAQRRPTLPFVQQVLGPLLQPSLLP